MEEEEKPQNIPPLTEGMQLHLLELIPKQHFTKPPPRFSVATLVKTLEELGIGRPSTYAPIISTIQERGYVKREQGRFFPTKLGVLVNSLLEKSFPDILNVRFTAEMEENLDRIEQGAADWVEVLKEFWDTFKPALRRADEEMEEVKAEEEEVVGESCPECGGEMKVKFGKFGKFLACSNFPNCKYTQAIKLDVSCPIDGCGGVVVERRSRRGRIFFGCSNYPECNFRSWDEPIKDRCPECGANLARGKRKVHCLACTYIK
jgi:DNA topoisomerase-1